jgi:hypothetical protein
MNTPEGDWVVEMDGARYPTSHLRDGSTLDSLASTVAPEDGEVSAILRRGQAIRTTVVPASALVTAGDGTTCLYRQVSDEAFTATTVTVVAGAAGVAEVSGIDPGEPVLANPSSVFGPIGCDISDLRLPAN